MQIILLAEAKLKRQIIFTVSNVESKTKRVLEKRFYCRINRYVPVENPLAEFN